MNISYRAYYVWKRNLISYKRFVIPTLLVSMGEPLFFLITFGIGLGAYIGLIGEKSYLNFLVPGILISATVISATFECLYGTFVRMVHEKLFDSLIATPISCDDVVTGEIFWGIFRGMISGTILIIFAVLFGAFKVTLLKLLLLFLLMAFTGFLFASLAMIVTSFAPNFDFFNYYSELIITPMLFFSGVFFPLDGFPFWVKQIAGFLPLTYAVTLSRAFFEGIFYPGLILDFILTASFGIFFFYLALFLMKRRIIK